MGMASPEGEALGKSNRKSGDSGKIIIASQFNENFQC